MKYEKPYMEVIEFIVDDVVTISLTGNTVGTDNGYEMPNDW